MMDKKFDIMQHPNIKLTADGGAMPYTHDKSKKFFKENLSVKLDETDGQNRHRREYHSKLWYSLCGHPHTAGIGATGRKTTYESTAYQND